MPSTLSARLKFINCIVIYYRLLALSILLIRKIRNIQTCTYSGFLKRGHERIICFFVTDLRPRAVPRIHDRIVG